MINHQQLKKQKRVRRQLHQQALSHQEALSPRAPTGEATDASSFLKIKPFSKGKGGVSGLKIIVPFQATGNRRVSRNPPLAEPNDAREYNIDGTSHSQTRILGNLYNHSATYGSAVYTESPSRPESNSNIVNPKLYPLEAGTVQQFSTKYNLLPTNEKGIHKGELSLELGNQFPLTNRAQFGSPGLPMAMSYELSPQQTKLYSNNMAIAGDIKSTEENKTEGENFDVVFKNPTPKQAQRRKSSVNVEGMAIEAMRQENIKELQETTEKQSPNMSGTLDSTEENNVIHHNHTFYKPSPNDQSRLKTERRKKKSLSPRNTKSLVKQTLPMSSILLPIVSRQDFKKQGFNQSVELNPLSNKDSQNRSMEDSFLPQGTKTVMKFVTSKTGGIAIFNNSSIVDYNIDTERFNQSKLSYRVTSDQVQTNGSSSLTNPHRKNSAIGNSKKKQVLKDGSNPDIDTLEKGLDGSILSSEGLQPSNKAKVEYMFSQKAQPFSKKQKPNFSRLSTQMQGAPDHQSSATGDTSALNQTQQAAFAINGVIPLTPPGNDRQPPMESQFQTQQQWKPKARPLKKDQIFSDGRMSLQHFVSPTALTNAHKSSSHFESKRLPTSEDDMSKRSSMMVERGDKLFFNHRLSNQLAEISEQQPGHKGEKRPTARSSILKKFANMTTNINGYQSSSFKLKEEPAAPKIKFQRMPVAMEPALSRNYIFPPELFSASEIRSFNDELKKAANVPIGTGTSPKDSPRGEESKETVSRSVVTKGGILPPAVDPSGQVSRVSKIESTKVSPIRHASLKRRGRNFRARASPFSVIDNNDFKITEKQLDQVKKFEKLVASHTQDDEYKDMGEMEHFIERSIDQMHQKMGYFNQASKNKQKIQNLIIEAVKQKQSSKIRHPLSRISPRQLSPPSSGSSTRRRDSSIIDLPLGNIAPAPPQPTTPAAAQGKKEKMVRFAELQMSEILQQSEDREAESSQISAVQQAQAQINQKKKIIRPQLIRRQSPPKKRELPKELNPIKFQTGVPLSLQIQDNIRKLKNLQNEKRLAQTAKNTKVIQLQSSEDHSPTTDPDKFHLITDTSHRGSFSLNRADVPLTSKSQLSFLGPESKSKLFSDPQMRKLKQEVIKSHKSQFYYTRGVSTKSAKDMGIDTKKEKFRKSMWSKMERQHSLYHSQKGQFQIQPQKEGSKLSAIRLNQMNRLNESGERSSSHIVNLKSDSRSGLYDFSAPNSSIEEPPSKKLTATYSSISNSHSISSMDARSNTAKININENEPMSPEAKDNQMDTGKVHNLYLMSLQKVIHEAQVHLNQPITQLEKKIMTTTGKDRSIQNWEPDLLKMINPKTVKQLKKFISENIKDLKFNLDSKNSVDFTHIFKSSIYKSQRSFLDFKKSITRDIKRLSQSTQVYSGNEEVVPYKSRMNSTHTSQQDHLSSRQNSSTKGKMSPGKRGSVSPPVRRSPTYKAPLTGGKNSNQQNARYIEKIQELIDQKRVEQMMMESDEEDATSITESLLSEKREPMYSVEEIVQNNINIEDLSAAQLVYLKSQALQATLKKKKARNLDKKLDKLEEKQQFGLNLSSEEIKNLMKDNRMVERYTEYICNTFFKYAEPFIRNKYMKYRVENKKFQTEDFFKRMQLDLEQRQQRNKQREQHNLVQDYGKYFFQKNIQGKGPQGQQQTHLTIHPVQGTSSTDPSIRSPRLGGGSFREPKNKS